ncbi:hypothetical protein MHYP_G00045950 [Metynnis hypsauchen]
MLAMAAALWHVGGDSTEFLGPPYPLPTRPSCRCTRAGGVEGKFGVSLRGTAPTSPMFVYLPVKTVRGSGSSSPPISSICTGLCKQHSDPPSLWLTSSWRVHLQASPPPPPFRSLYFCSSGLRRATLSLFKLDRSPGLSAYRDHSEEHSGQTYQNQAVSLRSLDLADQDFCLKEEEVRRSKAAGGPSSPAEPALPEVNKISWGKEGSPGPAQGPALFTLHSSMLIGRFGEDMTFRQCRDEATGHPSELVSRHSLFGRFAEEGGKKAEERSSK